MANGRGSIVNRALDGSTHPGWKLVPSSLCKKADSCIKRNNLYSGLVTPSSGCWSPIGGRVKYRCRLGMLKVKKLKHSYLNVMKLENYGPTGECIDGNHWTFQSCRFLYFTITFKIQKVQKWQTPFWNHKVLWKKKQKNTTFVRFSDYHLNIPQWVHSFLISLHWDSYALICSPLAYPSDI